MPDVVTPFTLLNPVLSVSSVTLGHNLPRVQHNPQQILLCPDPQLTKASSSGLSGEGFSGKPVFCIATVSRQVSPFPPACRYVARKMGTLCSREHQEPPPCPAQAAPRSHHQSKSAAHWGQGHPRASAPTTLGMGGPGLTGRGQGRHLLLLPAASGNLLPCPQGRCTGSPSLPTCAPVTIVFLRARHVV